MKCIKGHNRRKILLGLNLNRTNSVLRMTFEEKTNQGKMSKFQKWLLFLLSFVYLDEHYYLTARFPLKVLTAGVAAVTAL